MTEDKISLIVRLIINGKQIVNNSIKIIKKKYLNLPVQVKASFWFMICSFLQKGISVITTPIFTRLLSNSEYGQFSVYNSWMGIVTIIVTMNLSWGVYTQGLIKFDKERNVFSSTLQGLTLFLTIIWTVIYLLFRHQFNELMSITTLQGIAMLIIIWSSSAFNFWASEQRVLYKYKLLVSFTLIVSILQPSLGIVLIICSKDKVTARILGVLFAQIIIYSAGFIIQLLRGKKLFSKKFWKYAVVFNLPLIPHYLSQIVLSSADRIMIQNMVNDRAAGIYGLAYSLAQIMLLINTALLQTLNPWLFQQIKNKEFFRIEPIANIAIGVIVIFNLLLIVIAPEAVAFFAPKEYYEAIWVIPPVAVSSLFLFMYDLFAKFEFYYEKTLFVMIASIVGAIVNVILNYIFIGKFGYIAAGYTTMLCYGLYALGHYLFMNSICDRYEKGIRPYHGKKLALITLIFVVTALSIMVTYSYNWVRYGAIVIVCVVVLIKHDIIIKKVQQIINIRK